ncbi:MAG: phage tail protein, partial [Chloroflexota bacterium]
VEVQGIEVAYFSECSGLSLTTDTFEYSEGGLNSYTHKLPVRTKVGNITLKRGLVTADTLWTWYSAVVDGSINRKAITVNAYEQTAGTTSPTKISWSLADALPVKWTGPSFKASENAVAIDSLEFACGALTRVTGG